MTFRKLIILAMLVACVAVSSVARAETASEADISKRLDAASEYLDEGANDKAIGIIERVLEDDPSNPRALKLYLRANKAKAAADKKAAEVHKKVEEGKAMADVDEAARIPKKVITDEPPVKFKKLPSEKLSQEMREVLNQRVSMNLIDADLSYVLNLLFTTTGINIVADRSTLADKRLDIHVENARLVDLLDYIALNAGIDYTANESGIWITTPTQPQLEIRIYRLRYGVTRTGAELKANSIANQSSNTATSNTTGPTNPFNRTNNRYVPGGFNQYRPYNRKADEADGNYDSKIDSATGMPGGMNDDAFRSQMMSTIGRMMQMRADQMRAPGTTGTTGTTGTPGQTGNQQNAANAEKGDTDMEKLLDWIAGWSGNLQWPTGSTWRFDAKTNSLIVVSTPAILDKVQALIEEFDVPPIQVNIRTRFITVKVQEGTQWGVQGLLESALGQGGTNTTNRTQIDAGSGWNLSVPSGADTTGGMLTFRGVLTDPQYKIVMHALQTNLNGRLLSEPNVTTISNEPARLVVAEEYPYPTDWESVNSTVTTDGVTSTNTTAFVPTDFETENVGITLDVMPSVGSDLETIILELHPQIVAHDPNKDAKYNIIANTTTNDNGVQAFEVTRPTFSRQEIIAKVVIRSGETIVLGGLINEEDVTEVSKVPILGDIPALGLLFRKTVKNKARSNLLIFVTAEIVDTRGRFYHPSNSTTASSSGRDIMPDFVPSAAPNGNAQPNGNNPAVAPPDNQTGNTSQKPDAQPERYTKDSEKTRPTFEIDRPKPPRFGRRK